MTTNKPRVFIASSVEGLRVAEAINSNLDHETEPTLWTTGTFDIGSVPLVDLTTKATAVDFAIFVFTPEDVVKIREIEHKTVRDNVVFELGLFIGALGKDRCFMVRPRGVDMHLPSDLVGITPAEYAPDREDKNIASALNHPCTLIKDAIRKAGRLTTLPSAVVARRQITNAAPLSMSFPDHQVLAACMDSHFQIPDGVHFYHVNNKVQASEALVKLSFIRLEKMGLIERFVDESGEYPSYAFRVTAEGTEMFVASEEHYKDPPLRRAPAPAPAPRSRATPASSGFDDMNDDIPF